uniref:Uncharacterized protein n=1 Tax=Octopus bimaculoides TaxID=37653 RepID=A0A0L8I8Y4_OCTBM
MDKNSNGRCKTKATDNSDARSPSIERKVRQRKTCFPPIKQYSTEERIIPSRTDSELHLPDIREKTNRLFHDPSPQDIELSPHSSNIHHLPSVSSHPMVNFGYDWAQLKQQQKAAKSIGPRAAHKKQKAKKMKRSES